MSVNETLRNEYYVCLPERQAPIPWNPSDTSQVIDNRCNYFGKVFKAMEQSLETSDLTFYLTWDTNRLPSYGQNVVAVVHQNDWFRIPTYLDRVRAVFTTLAIRPTLGRGPLLELSYLNFLILLKSVKIWVRRSPSLFSYILLRLRRLLSSTVQIAPIYDIPLGYYNQLDLPIKDIKARRYDVSFAGSVVHESYPVWSVKRLLDTPKSVSRKKMVAALDRIQKEYPEFRVKLSITSGFESAWSADPKSYSQETMDAKICLVPRGAALETFRFFEALRYGCVVVTEALPSRWFYDGSPAMRVENWNDLEGILKKLIEDERLMQREHQRSLEWWRTKCSEAAVGAYVAGKLNSLKSSHYKSSI